MEQRCYTCKFWGADFFRYSHSSNSCKRHAPTVLISTDHYAAQNPVFPKMLGSDFCGDWEEMKSNQPEGEAK